MKNFSSIVQSGGHGFGIVLPQDFVKESGINLSSRIYETVIGESLYISKGRKNAKNAFSPIRHNGKYIRVSIPSIWVRDRGLSIGSKVGIKMQGEKSAVVLVLNSVL